MVTVSETFMLVGLCCNAMLWGKDGSFRGASLAASVQWMREAIRAA